MPRWLEELEAAMAAAGGRTRASRRSSRRSCGSSPTAATGWPSCSATRRSGPAVRARINALAYRPAALLEPELGARTPQLVAQLVQGVVNAGVRLLHGAGTLEEVEPLTVTLAQTLVRSRARGDRVRRAAEPDRGADARARARRGRAARRVRLEFVQRHADHPLLRRLEIEPVASQFPSTTTAHLTTLYTGLPVEQHGLYEWQIYEPGVDGIVILPLPFVGARGRAAAEARPARPRSRAVDLRAARRAVACCSRRRSRPGRTTRPRSPAPRSRPSSRFEDAAARLGATPGLTHLYWDAIDAKGHRHGPSSAEFDAHILTALDALAGVRDALLVVTADHGQIEVGEIDYLDVLWPPLREHLRRGPAGSARDCFLHVREPETVVGRAGGALGERAEVRLAAELFPDAGPRLRAASPTSASCPRPGRMAWLHATRRTSCASRATTAACTPEESRDLDRHDAGMNSGVSYAALDPDTEERFVLAAPRSSASRPSASTRSCSAPASAAASTATRPRRRSTSSWRAR